MLFRSGIIIHDGKIAGLQRGKDSVKEVKKGFECGITLESYSDLKEQDILECYEMVEVKKWIKSNKKESPMTLIKHYVK